MAVAGDGNCLYRALCVMERRHQDGFPAMKHNVLHHGKSTMTLDEWAAAAELLAAVHYASVNAARGAARRRDAWHREAEPPNTWGTATEVEIAARMLGRPIRVHMQNGRGEWWSTTYNQLGAGAVGHLWHRGVHWDPLVPRRL